MSATINSSTLPRFNYQGRLRELQTKLCFLEEKIGIATSSKLAFHDFAESPTAKLKERTILLPPWFLLKCDDIPPRFRITDIHDQRLLDERFLSDFASWINDRITGAGLPCICRPADFGILQLWVKTLLNRDLYEKCKEFSLAHELAHLHHFEQWETIINAAHMAVFSFSLLCFILLIQTLVPLIAVNIGVGIAFALMAGSLLALYYGWGSPLELPLVEQEKRADLDAAEMLGDARGGVYSYQTSMAHNLAVLRSNRAVRGVIDALGNNLNDKDHPPLSERVGYLSRWQTERYQVRGYTSASSAGAA